MMRKEQTPPDIALSPRRRYRQILELFFSIFLLALLFSFLDLDKARILLARVHISPLLALFLIYVMDRVFMAWKWLLLLRINPVSMSFYNAVKIYYVSSFIGFVLPLGGLGPDVVRFWKLRKSGMATEIIVGSMVMERVLGLMATLFMVLISLIVLLNLLPQNELEVTLRWSVALVGGSVLSTLAFAFNPRLRETILSALRIRRFSSWARADKYYQAIATFSQHPRLVKVNLFLSFIEQAFPIFALFLGSRAFGVELSILECLAIMPVALLLQRLLPISYAGLGVREGSYIVLLGLFGVDYSTALILSISLFMVFLVSLLPGAWWSVTETITPKVHERS